MATAKTKIIKVGEHNAYELQPARARSHYLGANNTGGQPYAFPIRGGKNIDAWFVVSRINGKILGVVDEYSDGDYGFHKLRGDGMPLRASNELAAQTAELKPGAIYYEVDKRVFSGTSIADAIRSGLGIR